MSSVNNISAPGRSLPSRIWQSTKTAVKNTYFLAPGLPVAAYAINQKLNDQPLWHTVWPASLTNQGNLMYGVEYYSGMAVGMVMAVQGARSLGLKWSGWKYGLTAFSGVVGAKALGVGVDFFNNHINNSVDLINSLSGGGVWYGGALAGLGTLYAIAKISKNSFAKLADALTPAALIAYGWGRIGCWTAGCCQGEIMGVPTELIQSTAAITLGFALTRLLKKVKNGYEGITAMFGLAGYALMRFVVEFGRKDESILYSGFRLSQWISLALVGSVSYLFARFLDKNNLTLSGFFKGQKP